LNYNDIDVDITWWCQGGKYQYDGSFKTMNNSFIQNGLTMMLLYASRQSNSLGVPTSSRVGINASQFITPSRSFSRGKIVYCRMIFYK